MSYTEEHRKQLSINIKATFIFYSGQKRTNTKQGRGERQLENPEKHNHFNCTAFVLHPGGINTVSVKELPEGTVGSQRLYVTVSLAKEVTLLDFRHKPDTNSTPLQPIY